jgi:hypothetical protein
MQMTFGESSVLNGNLTKASLEKNGERHLITKESEENLADIANHLNENKKCLLSAQFKVPRVPG